MKKLLLLITAVGCLLLVTSAARADIICVKKVTKVSQKNKISLNRVFKTTTEASCPKGYFQVLNTSELKGDKGDPGPAGADAKSNMFTAASAPVAWDSPGYFPVSGVRQYSVADESDVQYPVASPCTATRMVVNVKFGGTAQTTSVTLRKNGADTALACTYSDANGCRVSASVPLAEGDLLAFQWSGSRGGGDAVSVGWACESL